VTRSPSTPVLELEDARIGYDGRTVVDDVSLTITSGEVVAILGANGSGKSTLVRGILGLAQHQAGTIEAFGTPIAQLRDRWRLGYVPQRDTLARGIPATVQEVVASGRLSRSRPWRRTTATDHAKVRAAIGVVGLGGRDRALVTELSGGQQRRVLVARALAGDAELLILDEPTAGVDAENQQALADTMATLAAAGTTILLVAHELGPAASIVTRVLVVSAGHLAYDGPPRSQDVHGSDHHHLAASEEPGRFGLGG
jgi:zinc transport system ATP-binding protein